MAAASFDGDVVRHSGGAAGGGGGTLGVHGASRKIGKAAAQQRKPVIIYMVSPKIIHAEAHEFMSLVQRLTGPEPDGGHGDEKRASPSSSSSPRPASGAARKGGAGSGSRAAAAPVRVKARALNRPGPAVSVSVTATSAAPPAPGTSPSGFLFHDLSPLRGPALKGEPPLVSPGWLHHVAGDHYFSPGAPPLGSPSAFLDIFGPLSSQHQ